MSVYGINGLSGEEYRKYLVQISRENSGGNGTPVRAVGSLPETNSSNHQTVKQPEQSDLVVNRPEVGHDKFDYYVSGLGKVATFGEAMIGTGTLEQAVGIAGHRAFKEDGTVNYITMEERLQTLRANGLPAELNWDMMDKYYLSAISNKTIGSGVSLNASANELAATYAVLKEQIGRDFSGDEYNLQLDKLEQLFHKHIDRLAKTFASSVNDFFAQADEKWGAGEYDKLYNSLQAAIAEKKEEYAAFIKQNKDYAGVEGTKDEWLLRSYRYMSTKLQEAVNSKKSDGGTPVKADDSLYQFDELCEIDRFATLGNKIIRDASCYSNEEEFGFRLGLMKLQSEYLLQTSNVPQAYRDSLSRGVKHSINKAIVKVDQRYADDRRINPNSRRSPPLDRQAIFDVVDLMLKVYAESKDLLTAIQKGASKAHSTFLQKQSDSFTLRARYGRTEDNFWKRFYTPQEMRGQTHKPIMTQIIDQFQDVFGINISANLNVYA